MSNTEKPTTKEVSVCEVDLPTRGQHVELRDFIRGLQDTLSANPGKLMISFGSQEWGSICEITLRREKTPEELAQEDRRQAAIIEDERRQYLRLHAKWGAK